MITTYSELQTAIITWMDRDDLTSTVPDFITLAEAEFNRTIWTPETEFATTLSVTGPTTYLPSDFRAVRSIYIDSDPKVVPEQMSLSDLRWFHSEQTTGAISNFAIQGDSIVWGPAPDTTYSVPLVYYQTITNLSTTETSNWLLDSHPDIYLYGALMAGAVFMDIGDPRLKVWAGLKGAALDQLREAGVKKANGNTPQRIRSAYVV